MKKLLGACLGLALVFTGVRHTARALPAASVTVSPTRAQVGETVTVSGSFDADALVSVKATDGDGNIVFFNAVRANSAGKFQDSFKVPDMDPGTLTVTTGSGSDTAKVRVTVYVQKYFTVTFDKNGGGNAGSPAMMTVQEGGLIASKPSAPTRSGYTFGGWYKDKNCAYAWDFASDRVTGAMTLYAGWKLKPATASSTTQPPKPTASLAPTASFTPTTNASAAPTGHLTATVGSGQTLTVEPSYTPCSSQGAQATVRPGEIGSPLASSASAVKAAGGFTAMRPWFALIMILAIIASVLLLRAILKDRRAQKERNARTRLRTGKRQ